MRIFRERNDIKMKAIDNKELILALEELEKEKGNDYDDD